MIGTVSGKAVHNRVDGRRVLNGAWLCLDIVDTASLTRVP